MKSTYFAPRQALPFLNVAALALTSAVAFAAALPNEILLYGSPVLGFVALAPYYLAIREAATHRHAVYAGCLFGAVSTVLSNYWLANFGDFAVWTVGGVTIGYIGYNALLSSVLWTVMRSRRDLRPLLFAVAWAGYEFFKSIGYLGYPWGLSPYPFVSILPALQIVDITGVYALSFLAVLVNALVAELSAPRIETLRLPGETRLKRTFLPAVPTGPNRPHPRLAYIPHVAWWGLCVGLVLIYGSAAFSRDIPKIDEFEAVLVQQNMDAWDPGAASETIRRSQELTREAIRDDSPPDIVLWSETTLRYPYPENRDGFYATQPAGDPFRDFLSELDNAPLLAGAPYVADESRAESWNAALLIDSEGNLIDRYGKQQLVPFAENVPFWEVPQVRSFFQNVVGLPAVWSIATEETIFELSTGSGKLAFAAPICFEDAFSGVVRDLTREGADLHMNLTNNAWSETKSAQTQHLTAALFRAIENRRTLVRSTNAGVTTVVDPWGRRPVEFPMFLEMAEQIDVPVYRPEQLTVFTTLGNVFGVIAVAITLVAVGAVAHRAGHLPLPGRSRTGLTTWTDG